ncbi:MAG: hypothetical protein EA401_09585 [Planctomycetota bacterium]|nr:MAG: hypothetical protein EA401_09585 [Planctomycetota bacterium]
MARSKRRSRPAILVPVASMGDIAFLLIAFFVLASRFSDDAGISVTRPMSEDIDVVDDKPPVSVIMDEESLLFVNGEEIVRDRLLSTVERHLASYDTERRKIMVTIDANLTYYDFEPIAEILAETGAPLMLAGQRDPDAPPPRTAP